MFFQRAKVPLKVFFNLIYYVVKRKSFSEISKWRLTSKIDFELGKCPIFMGLHIPKSKWQLGKSNHLGLIRAQSLCFN